MSERKRVLGTSECHSWALYIHVRKKLLVLHSILPAFRHIISNIPLFQGKMSKKRKRRHLPSHSMEWRTSDCLEQEAAAPKVFRVQGFETPSSSVSTITAFVLWGMTSFLFFVFLHPPKSCPTLSELILSQLSGILKVQWLIKISYGNNKSRLFFYQIEVLWTPSTHWLLGFSMVNKESFNFTVL